MCGKAQLCAAVDEGVREHEMWMCGMNGCQMVCMCGLCVKVNGVLEGGPMGPGRCGTIATHTTQKIPCSGHQYVKKGWKLAEECS